MGSKSRMKEAHPHETAQQARARLRKDAAIIREDYLLELYASGLTREQIAVKMRERFGMGSVTTIQTQLPRALARRAALVPESFEAARERFLVRLEAMYRAWAPRALGLLSDPDTGLTAPPDVRLGELLLKVATRIAEVEGGVRAPEQHHTNTTTVNVLVPQGDRDQAEAAVLAALEKEALKYRVVQGQLAGVGTALDELTGGHAYDDTMAPPAGALPPGVTDQVED